MGVIIYYRSYPSNPTPFPPLPFPANHVRYLLLEVTWNEGHSDHKDFVKFPTVITMPWGYNLRSEGSLFLSKILAIKVFRIWNEICKVYSHVNEKPGFVLLVL